MTAADLVHHSSSVAGTRSSPAPTIAAPPPAAWRDRSVTDGDRARVVERLRLVAIDALDLDDFSLLVEDAWRADTWSELHAIAARAPLPPPPDPSRESVVALGWPARRAGGWRPSAVVTASAFLGNAVLDLTEAEWDGRPVCIVASAVLGGVEVVVPHDVRVELSGWSFLGGVRVVGRRPQSQVGGHPLVSVRAQALAGSVTVRRHAFRPSARGHPAPEAQHA
jgi:hypothetical protein